MKNSTFYVALTLCLALSQANAIEQPDILKRRCMQDRLNHDRAAGRNAWARNCGLITQSDFDELMADSTLQYVSFTKNAPTDPQAPCKDDEWFAICYEDCFTPSQKIRFGDGYLPIVYGANARKTKLITLAEESSMNHLIFTQEDIESFIEGEKYGHIIVMKGSNGHKLQVTPNHPMFDETGKLQRAGSVRIGDFLLTEDGSTQVVDIQTQTYKGPVWNLSPVSSEARANTNIAEGFITGSERFQAEWANENFRYLLRSRLDTNGI